MKKISDGFFEYCHCIKLFSFALTLLAVIKIQAQPCDPPPVPALFGPSVTSIFCKNNSIGFGVNGSDLTQVYYFSVYKDGVETSKKGGPLDGNGQQLSVSTAMKSARDAGEYRITTFNECGKSASISFFAFYGGIDNLSITAWGSDAVSFRWAASGPLGSVTYEYAVSTQPNPDLALNDYVTTTDTTASKIDLIAGTTYYIHVRVSRVDWNGSEVIADPFFSDCSAGLPWQTINFVSCSGAATAGLITPANGVVCLSGTATFTATGGNTYQWYDENNNPISGATLSSYIASSPGQYKVFTTTSAGCQGIVSTATLTQTSLQQGVFSGGGCYNIGDSVRLGISKTLTDQTYKILKDGIEVASVQGIGTVEFSNSEDTVWYNFKLTSATQYGHYTVRANNPYCTAIDFGDQTISGSGTWTGTLNTDWQNPANWTCSSVPDANTDVIIPFTGVPNMPLINGNVSCKSVVVMPGATLRVVSGFKLNITGN